MQWRQWLAEIGVYAPASPNIDGPLIAAVLVAGSWGMGWFVGARAGPRLAVLLTRWTGRSESLAPDRISGILRHALTALVLFVVGRSAAVGEVGLMIIAAALGLAVGMLVFRLLRAAGLGPLPSAALGTTALVVAAAGLLGGMAPLIQALGEAGVSLGTRHVTLLEVINVIILAAVLLAIARFASRVIDHSIGRMTALDPSQRLLVQKLAGIALVAVLVLVGVDLVGVDLTALAVFSGALGLAVGFGLQKTLGNLVAGLILLMDRSVKPGDVIVVGDTFGTVNKIGVRAVSVLTRDGKEHLIPNEQLMTEPVENWSYSNRNVRVHIPVGVAYTCDLALAQKLMLEAAKASPRVLSEPKPAVRLERFGDSSVDHDIRVWITDPELGVGIVRSEILNRLWVLFKENGIEIPFPQRVVHVRSRPVPPEAAEAPGERGSEKPD